MIPYPVLEHKRLVTSTRGIGIECLRHQLAQVNGDMACQFTEFHDFGAATDRMALATRSRSACVMAVPEGRHRPSTPPAPQFWGESSSPEIGGLVVA